MAIWNTFRKNSFKFGYEGHLVLTVYLKKYLMGKWLRGPDLNRRPSGYEPDELPSCSTPRLMARNILVSKIIARFKLNLTFRLLRK